MNMAGLSVRTRRASPDTQRGTVASGWKQYRQADVMQGTACHIREDPHPDAPAARARQQVVIEARQEEATAGKGTNNAADPSSQPSPQQEEPSIQHEPHFYPEFVRSHLESNSLHLSAKFARDHLSPRYLHDWAGRNPFHQSDPHNVRMSPDGTSRLGRYKDLQHSVFYSATRSPAQMWSPRASRPGVKQSLSHLGSSLHVDTEPTEMRMRAKTAEVADADKRAGKAVKAMQDIMEESKPLLQKYAGKAERKKDFSPPGTLALARMDRAMSIFDRATMDVL
eukprot:g7348.t1